VPKITTLVTYDYSLEELSKEEKLALFEKAKSNYTLTK